MSHEAIACILQQEAEAVLNIPVTSGYEEAELLLSNMFTNWEGN